MKTHVSCVALENFQVQVRTQQHSWVADEPERLGGDALGPNPFDMLLGALGTCTLITVYHHAAEAGIPLEQLTVDLAGEWKGQGDEQHYTVHTTLRVRGDLDEDALEQLRAAADQCPVHKLLSRGANIQTQIVRL